MFLLVLLLYHQYNKTNFIALYQINNLALLVSELRKYYNSFGKLFFKFLHLNSNSSFWENKVYVTLSLYLVHTVVYDVPRFTYVLWSSKNQFKCEYADSFVWILYGQFKVDIGYVIGTTYKNQMRGINNMLNSLKRRKVNPLLKKSYILINFIEISFSVFRAIGKVHIMKKY